MLAQLTPVGQTGDNRTCSIPSLAWPGKSSVARRPRISPGSGYLESLLERLDVNVNSQVLVFSKTSFQHAFISPRNPRAIYFNDAVAIGTVPGGDVLELTALDSAPAFRSIRCRGQGRETAIRASRRRMHVLPWTGQSWRFRSRRRVRLSGRRGASRILDQLFRGTDHRTPFTERWGGWYVTVHTVPNDTSVTRLRPIPFVRSSSSRSIARTSRHWGKVRHHASPDAIQRHRRAHDARASERDDQPHQRRQRPISSSRASGIVGDAVWKQLDPAVEELVTYMVFADEASLESQFKGRRHLPRRFRNAVRTIGAAGRSVTSTFERACSAIPSRT